jgi:hypothetical protein
MDEAYAGGDYDLRLARGGLEWMLERIMPSWSHSRYPQWQENMRFVLMGISGHDDGLSMVTYSSPMEGTSAPDMVRNPLVRKPLGEEPLGGETLGEETLGARNPLARGTPWRGNPWRGKPLARTSLV